MSRLLDMLDELQRIDELAITEWPTRKSES